jgi:hypothetical protein
MNDDEAMVYLVTETWCDDEGCIILGAFSTREKAEAWRVVEVSWRSRAGSDSASARSAARRLERMLEVVEMPVDPSHGVAILPPGPPIG